MMITVYQPPTPEKPSYSLVYMNFDGMAIEIKERQHDHYPTAMAELEEVKSWITLSTFEIYRHGFESAVPESERTQDIKETLIALTKACQLMIDNWKTYKIVLDEVVKNINFMRILAKATPDEYRPTLKMVATMLVRHVKAELDEKNQDKKHITVAPNR